MGRVNSSENQIVGKLLVLLRREMWKVLEREKLIEGPSGGITSEGTCQPSGQQPRYFERLSEVLITKALDTLADIENLGIDHLEPILSQEESDRLLRAHALLSKPGKVQWQAIEKEVTSKLKLSAKQLKRILCDTGQVQEGKSLGIIYLACGFKIDLSSYKKANRREIEAVKLPAPKKNETVEQKRIRRITDDNMYRVATIYLSHPRMESVSLVEDGLYVERKQQDEILGFIYNCVEKGVGGFYLLQGEAGFGKSTLLWWLCRELNRRADAEIWAHFWKSTDLESWQGREVIVGSSQIDYLYSLNGQQKQVIFLDTLDNRLEDDGSQIKLEADIQSLLDRNWVVIGTSRPREARRLDGFMHSLNEVPISKAVLGKYDDAEMKEAIRRHVECMCSLSQELGVDAQFETRRLVDAAIRGFPIEPVVRNPLTLRMLFVVFFPNLIPLEINSLDIYGLFWRNRVESDTRQGQDSTSSYLKKTRADVAAMYLAWKMLVNGRPVLQDFRLSEELLLWGIEHSDIDSLDKRGVITIDRRLGTVQFFHQSLFEFAAAKGLLHIENRLLGLGESGIFSSFYNRITEEAIDFFELPIFENTLVLGENTSREIASQSINLCKSLLMHSDVTLRESGVLVYQSRLDAPATLQTQLWSAFIGHEKILINKFLIEGLSIANEIRAKLFIKDLEGLVQQFENHIVPELMFTCMQRLALIVPSETNELLGKAALFRRYILPALDLPRTPNAPSLPSQMAIPPYANVIAILFPLFPQRCMEMLREIIERTADRKRSAGKGGGRLGIVMVGTELLSYAMSAVFRYADFDRNLGALSVLVDGMTHIMAKFDKGEFDKRRNPPVWEMGLFWYMMWKMKSNGIALITMEIVRKFPKGSSLRHSQIAGLFYWCYYQDSLLSEGDFDLVWAAFYNGDDDIANRFEWGKYFWIRCFQYRDSSRTLESLAVGFFETCLRNWVGYFGDSKRSRSSSGRVIAKRHVPEVLRMLSECDMNEKENAELVSKIDLKATSEILQDDVQGRYFQRAMVSDPKWAANELKTWLNRDAEEFSEFYQLLLRRVELPGDCRDPYLKQVLAQLAIRARDVEVSCRLLKSMTNGEFGWLFGYSGSFHSWLDALYQEHCNVDALKLQSLLVEKGILDVPTEGELVALMSKSWELREFMSLKDMFTASIANGEGVSEEMESFLVRRMKEFYEKDRHRELFKDMLLESRLRSGSVVNSLEECYQWVIETFALMRSRHPGRIEVLYAISREKEKGDVGEWGKWFLRLLEDLRDVQLGKSPRSLFAHALKRMALGIIRRASLEDRSEVVEMVIRYAVTADDQLGKSILYGLMLDESLRHRLADQIEDLYQVLKQHRSGNHKIIERYRLALDRPVGGRGWAGLHHLGLRALKQGFQI